MSIRIEKSWFFFGSPLVIYSCPSCGGELKSPVADIGQDDICPECDQRFVVPGESEFKTYIDSKRPKLAASQTDQQKNIPNTQKPTTRRQSHSKYIEDHIKNIAKLDKVKAKALKDRRMSDYADSVLNQADSYEQIAQNYDGDENDDELIKIVNANFLESTIKNIEYEYLLINGAWNPMDKSDSIWDKQLRDAHQGFCIGILQPYSGMGGDPLQLENLFIEVTTKVQRSLKCPISPRNAWKVFSKAMKRDKEKIKHLL